MNQAWVRVHKRGGYLQKSDLRFRGQEMLSIKYACHPRAKISEISWSKIYFFRINTEVLLKCKSSGGLRHKINIILPCYLSNCFFFLKRRRKQAPRSKKKPYMCMCPYCARTMEEKWQKSNPTTHSVSFLELNLPGTLSAVLFLRILAGTNSMRNIQVRRLWNSPKNNKSK